jgi:hypothetical protein
MKINYLKSEVEYSFAVLDDVEHTQTVVHLTATVQADDTAQGHALAAALDKFLREQVKGQVSVAVTPAPAARMVVRGPVEPIVSITPAPQYEPPVVVPTYDAEPPLVTEFERPVVDPSDAPSESPKKRRGRPPKSEATAAEPAPVVAEPAPEPAPAPVPPPAPAFVFSAAQERSAEPEADPEPPAKLSGGVIKVDDQQFACTYKQTGVYVTCTVAITAELAAKLGVEAKTFSSTGDSKKDAGGFVSEQIADYLETQRWAALRKEAAGSSPAMAETPAPAPAPAPASAPEPELTAQDDPKIPPEVLRIMMESRKLADTAVRSEVVSLWTTHLIQKHGMLNADDILAHLTKHQVRLVMFEKKPLGSSVLRLIEALLEGNKRAPAAKAKAFKPEPEAVTSVPGDDEIDESDIPY